MASPRPRASSCIARAKSAGGFASAKRSQRLRHGQRPPATPLGPQAASPRPRAPAASPAPRITYTIDMSRRDTTQHDATRRTRHNTTRHDATPQQDRHGTTRRDMTRHGTTRQAQHDTTRQTTRQTQHETTRYDRHIPTRHVRRHDRHNTTRHDATDTYRHDPTRHDIQEIRLAARRFPKPAIECSFLSCSVRRFRGAQAQSPRVVVIVKDQLPVCGCHPWNLTKWRFCMNSIICTEFILISSSTRLQFKCCFAEPDPSMGISGELVIDVVHAVFYL